MTYAADQSPVQSLRERDADTLVSLYDEYGAAVHSVFFRAIRDEQRADDLTHCLFVKVWNQPELLENVPLLRLAADMADCQLSTSSPVTSQPKIYNLFRQFVAGFTH